MAICRGLWPRGGSFNARTRVWVRLALIEPGHCNTARRDTGIIRLMLFSLMIGSFVFHSVLWDGRARFFTVAGCGEFSAGRKRLCNLEVKVGWGNDSVGFLGKLCSDGNARCFEMPKIKITKCPNSVHYSYYGRI